MRLDVTLAGDKVLSRDLLRFADDVEDARDSFRRASHLVFDIEERIFDTGGWGKWAARKDDSDPSRPLLVLTGALKESWTQQGGANQVFEVRPASLELGSQVPYSKFHQTGTRKMPRRSMTDWREADKQMFLKRFQAELLKDMA